MAQSGAFWRATLPAAVGCTCLHSPHSNPSPPCSKPDPPSCPLLPAPRPTLPFPSRNATQLEALSASGAPPVRAERSHAFLCGPPSFMGAAEAALEAAVGVPSASVHQESFSF